MIIESAKNPIFRDALRLQDKKFRDESGLFFVEGQKQIGEISKNWTIKQIFRSKKYKNDITDSKSIITLSDHLFNKLSTTKSPQGIIAIVEKKHYNIEKVIKTSGLFIILENIQDPGNLGTIIRSADAFGVKAVFVSKESADTYSNKTVRATMGSIFHLPIIGNIEIKYILNLMKKEKFTVFAASLKGKKYLNNIKFSNKSVLLIGNEANGLKSETENLADVFVKIHMPGHTESLNVAVAASIIMYEYLK
ncbi:MAG: RNA methyltransferase [Endomicrobium sp.]|nr:RNA methyltransferase [Endomicrobium sp.]